MDALFIPKVNKFRQEKNYIITKVRSLSEINNSMKEKLKKALSPSDYLNLNSNIIIGKSPNFPKLNNRKELKPYSIVGPKSLFDSSMKKQSLDNRNDSFRTRNLSSKKSRNTLNSFARLESRKSSLFINSEIEKADDKKIRELFNTYKRFKDYNAEKYNDFIGGFSQGASKPMKQFLTRQENILENTKNWINDSERLSRNIASRIKVPKEHLLMYKSQIYRTKGEIKEKMWEINKSNLVNLNSQANWLNSLRNDSKEKRVNYISIGAASDLYARDTNKKADLNESIKPNIDYDKVSASENRFLHGSLSCLNIDLDRFKSTGMNIRLDGQDLLNEEFSIGLNMKGKKIIRKFPDNNKSNQVKDEIICEHYDREFLKNM